MPEQVLPPPPKRSGKQESVGQSASVAQSRMSSDLQSFKAEHQHIGRRLYKIGLDRQLHAATISVAARAIEVSAAMGAQ